MIQKLPTLCCILLAAVCVFGTVTLPGCGTWKQTSYKTTGTVAITVETAMKTWANYVASGKAKPEQEAAIRAAYTEYQTSMLAVIESAKAASASGDQTGLQVTTANAANMQAALVKAISSFVP